MTPSVRVLVVDDDALMRDIVRRVLVQAGIAVETYSCASGLLEQADLHTPAVLLLDVNMPAMSGLELQVKLRQRGIVLPVVFLTGASTVAMAVMAMRDGAVDFIEKPFDGAELVARVRLAYARHVQRIAVQDPVSGPEYRLRQASLTPREREVMDLMITGRTSKTIARELGGSFRTIEIHRGRVMNKMDAATLSDLVRMSLAAGAVRD